MMHFGKQKTTQLKCKGVDVQLQLVPYSPGCPGTQTPHHLIPDRCTTGMPGYSHGKAPCICVQGKNQHTGSHRGCHRIFDPVERYHQKPKKFTYAKARDAAAKSAGGGRTPPKKLTKKELECVKAQLDEYYKKAQPDGPGLKDNSGVTASGAPGKVNELWPAVQASAGQVPVP
ncbi:HNH/endonuclease VII fold toxin-2 domain-containing protein [Roseateles violae]|uniref:HNH/endonuclease VII fold toxin-2 domain-containing protein n=1 Tax=Roseateles violae TaxID=3058042 RepID=A0ABT8DPT1_9BURK|nr:HNH/endonuclease VII fold toxin-2 domain-containing protein [Pelomonas sp. PFR6]MDN3920018.1 HNH/endonuclease VII fold toxin-2 domain-containing protein [Pelomonas sp. PFR6]